jgi:hypothetical protein
MKLSRLLPVALLAFPVLTNAQTPQPSLYVGAAFGSTQADYSDVDSSSSTILSVGYNLPGSNWGVEFSALDLGEADVDFSDITVDAGGVRGMLAFNSNFYTDTPMNIYLKGGFYRLDVEVSEPGISVEESSTGFVYSVGMEFYLSPSLAVGGEMTSYTDVDFIASEEDATFLGLSGRLMF